MQIEIKAATSEEKPVLERLWQLYIYDFSEFEHADLDDRGLYDSHFLSLYFTEGDRYPFLVRVNGSLAGFVLVNNHTVLPDAKFSIAEFFIARKYRRAGIGTKVAMEIFDRFKGRWEVREISNNLPAQAFWRKVIGEYTHHQYQEIILSDDRWDGPIQCFDTPISTH